MAESYTFSHWGSTSEDMLKSQFPLHMACRDGEVDKLSSLLIDAQHGVYEEDSFYGWTPAHWAAYFGKLACLMKLHECGVNSDASTHRLNQSPLQIAAFAGQGHCLKWLLHCGCRIDRQDYLGETPIHKAARTGSMECCSLLVSHGARLYICNNCGVTPAELASSCGYTNCAQYLESAAAAQESQPRGIYQNPPGTSSSASKPSPLDVTTTNTTIINGGTVPVGHPVHLQNGVNGDLHNGHLTNGHLTNGHLTNGVDSSHSHNGAVGKGMNGHHTECDMEEDMEASSQDSLPSDLSLTRLFAQPDPDTALTNGAVHGDVTTNPDISTNRLPVAGCKRTREVNPEEGNVKRQRTADCSTLQAQAMCLNSLRDKDNVSMETTLLTNDNSAYEMIKEFQPIRDNVTIEECEVNEDSGSDYDSDNDIQEEDFMEDEEEEILPYLSVLSLSCEPMTPVVMIDSHNEKMNYKRQHWAVIV